MVFTLTLTASTSSPVEKTLGRLISCCVIGSSLGVKKRSNKSASSVRNVSHCYCSLSSHDRLQANTGRYYILEWFISFLTRFVKPLILSDVGNKESTTL